MTDHKTRDVAGVLHFLTPQQMAEEIVRLDAQLAAFESMLAIWGDALHGQPWPTAYSAPRVKALYERTLAARGVPVRHKSGGVIGPLPPAPLLPGERIVRAAGVSASDGKTVSPQGTAATPEQHKGGE